MKIIPIIFDNNKVTAAQSTRNGGVSTGVFNSLNLGMSVNDNADHVKENRTRFFGSLGFSLQQISISKQVHGVNVLHAQQPGICEGYDAQITNVPGVCLAVSVADCVPVLLHDPVKNAVAAIHAGWRGTAGEIVVQTIAQMQEKFGTQAADIRAFIGACISVDFFEVGDEVAKEFPDDLKVFYPEKNKFHIDLKKANRMLLEKAGVKPIYIEVSEYCTWNNNDLFFSHRKNNGNTGRMMAAIGLLHS
jgi:YfiH family protein